MTILKHHLIRLGLTAICCATLGACEGNFGGRLDPVIASSLGPDVDALSTGADRRLVLASQVTRYAGRRIPQADGSTLTVNEAGKELVVCAEPAPDVAEALAASLSASASASRSENEKVEAALERQLATSIGALVKRSQGLQFFRDGVFALCQGSMNGINNPKVIAEEFEALRLNAVKLIEKEIMTEAWNTPVQVTIAAPNLTGGGTGK